HPEVPGRHRGNTFAAVSERARAELAAAGIRHSDVMRLRCPVDAHEPIALLLHRAPPCCRSRRDADRSLYWRSRRRLPTGSSPRPLAGAHVPPMFSTHMGRVEDSGTV